MNNQKITWSEIAKQIDLTENFKDLMQLYLNTHEKTVSYKTLTHDDFDFLRILFGARFNELKHIDNPVKK